MTIHIHHLELLTPKNIREILDLTWSHRARWKLIAINLGIEIGTIDAIAANHKYVEDCLTNLISTWLRATNPRPTRAAIDAVLSSQHILIAAGNLHIIFTIGIACNHGTSCRVLVK